MDIAPFDAKGAYGSGNVKLVNAIERLNKIVTRITAYAKTNPDPWASVPCGGNPVRCPVHIDPPKDDPL